MGLLDISTTILMKINLKQLQDNLSKQQLEPIYFIYGQENFLLDQAKKSFNQLPSDIFEAINLNGNEIDLMQLNQELSITSFFGQKKIVIVDYFDQILNDKNENNLKFFGDYLTNPFADNSLVLIIHNEKPDQRRKIIKQLLADNITTLEFNQIDQKQITTYTRQQFAKNQIEISNQLIEYIIQRSNFNLTNLSQNLSKLIDYSKTNSLDEKAIDDLFVTSIESNAFDLVKYIFSHDKRKALLTINQLFDQKQLPLSILAAITSQYRLLLQVDGLKNQTTSQLKIHPYRVKLAQQELQNISIETIENGYQKIIETEIKLKTTNLNQQNQIEQLVVSLIE